MYDVQAKHTVLQLFDHFVWSTTEFGEEAFIEVSPILAKFDNIVRVYVCRETLHDAIHLKARLCSKTKLLGGLNGPHKYRTMRLRSFLNLDLEFFFGRFLP